MAQLHPCYILLYFLPQTRSERGHHLIQGQRRELCLGGGPMTANQLRTRASFSEKTFSPCLPRVNDNPPCSHMIHENLRDMMQPPAEGQQVRDPLLFLTGT